MWVLLYRFILVFASNNLASLNSVLRGNASCASKTLSQNPCQLCPPYLPIMWYFLPFQVNTSCATFKLFKSYYLLFVSMFYSSWGSMWCFIFQPCHLLLTDFHQWTSGIYIRLSNNFAKRAGKRGAQSQLITTFINNSLHMFCPDLSVSNLICK